MRCHVIRGKIAKASANPTGISGAGNRGQKEPFSWPGYSLRPRAVRGEELG